MIDRLALLSGQNHQHLFQTRVLTLGEKAISSLSHSVKDRKEYRSESVVILTIPNLLIRD